MKKKLMKAFDAIFSWKTLMWMNIIVAAMQVIAAAYYREPRLLWEAFEASVFALFCHLLHQGERKVQAACRFGAIFKLASDMMLKDLERYKKLYGELPKEKETDEQPESEKQNSENPSETGK